MHVHLCFPVAAADPLQLWLSPGIPLLFAPLLLSQLSVPPVRAAVCQPTHPTATCPCSRHRDMRARTGDKKCLGSSTCLPGQHLHQPAMAMVVRGGETRGCRGWGKHCQEDFGASSVCVFISERCILERGFHLCA